MSKIWLLILLVFGSLFINDKVKLLRTLLFLFGGIYVNFNYEFNFTTYLYIHLLLIYTYISSVRTMFVENVEKGLFYGIQVPLKTGSFDLGLSIPYDSSIKKKIGFKALFFGSYTLTFVLMYFNAYSSNFKNEIKNKAPIVGERGNRGFRGRNGNGSLCKNGCPSQNKMCYKKILTHITNEYNNIIKNDEFKNNNFKFITKGKYIKNKFLKNKVKDHCNYFIKNNHPFDEIIKKKGSEKTYEWMINNNWSKWIKNILRYENGHNFIHNEELNDNNFDNMLKHDETSPFDEIKKYDLWYWGASKNEMPIIVEDCKIGDKNEIFSLQPKIKTIESNSYGKLINWLKSTSKVDNSTLPSNFFRVDNYYDYSDDIEYRDYKPLGDVLFDIDNNNINSCFPKMDPKNIYNKKRDKMDNIIKKKTLLVSGIGVKEPIDYDLITQFKYTQEHNQTNYESLTGYTIWKPLAPDGYEALGYVITPSYSKNLDINKFKPSLNLIYCIKSEYLNNEMDTGVEKKIYTKKNNIAQNSNINFYTNKYGLFKVNDNKFKTINKKYLYPLGEDYKKLENNWEYQPKNGEKYSILNIYE